MPTINDEVNSVREHDKQVKREKGIFELFKALLPEIIAEVGPSDNEEKKLLVNDVLWLAKLAYDEFDEAFGVDPLQLD